MGVKSTDVINREDAISQIKEYSERLDSFSNEGLAEILESFNDYADGSTGCGYTNYIVND